MSTAVADRAAEQPARMSHQRHRTITCARCHQTQPLKSRGLCPSCDGAARRDGSIADYAATYHHAGPLLDDYRILRVVEGYTHQQIANRLGVRLPTLRRALTRARARGDARAAA